MRGQLKRFGRRQVWFAAHAAGKPPATEEGFVPSSARDPCEIIYAT
jgi:hypothetical protein